MSVLIFESPNKGKTVYGRKFGAPHNERKLIMDINILVVGINPSDKEHYKNNTMKRLAIWMNRMDLNKYSFTNCITTLGKYTKSMVDYDDLKERVDGFDKVIALGGFVSDALDKIGMEHFKLPHPSGLNRQINDSEFVEKELSKCLQWLRNAV